MRKIVFASTNHVMGFYALDQAFPVDTRAPIRPDSLYGVSKAFGEALARYYSDTFGMSMMCVRIGWFTPQRSVDRVAQSAVDQRARPGADRGAVRGVDARFWNLQRDVEQSAARVGPAHVTEELGYAPVGRRHAGAASRRRPRLRRPAGGDLSR